MEIKTTYIGTKTVTYEESGETITETYNGVWCGFRPSDIQVSEEKNVLYPAEGYELENINTKKRFSSVWLKNGDSQQNYIEVEIQEEPGYLDMSIEYEDPDEPDQESN